MASESMRKEEIQGTSASVRMTPPKDRQAGSECCQCPRRCHARRAQGQVGFCGMPETLYVSRIAPHMWEEPPISGSCGSGTVFFAGCNLRCSFCQNRVISHERRGTALTEDDLIHRILALADTGVHNINLVTPTHYTDALAHLLERVKPRLHIPVVWNCGGYESPEALARLEGLVDIYLPDFKYVSPELSQALSGAADYGTVATTAVQTMYAQTGPVLFDEAGMMKRGLLIRHLVLPGYRRESIAVLEHLSAILPLPEIRVSIMSQYTPEFATDCPQKSLHRRLTDFEYQSVLEAADRLGIVGYRQGRASATGCYTPDFGEGKL